ncbi:MULTISPECIES: ankyrin repeat domain-containing protein [Flavobacterium]|uniref:Ankyrin repeat-containing protein n=1 Tax=Flavobacterium anhuiense TaxID=459526 RepID=A0AAC9D775_9FLAO|nr:MULTISPECIES: ankyrin repeat domain-containing protein [Flavobacterium]AOC96707.1 Ankyrin repeats (3 copies) [Flavobacterium anhuiense]MXO05006.1 ankyrin repeat domain-containing protein [Flavobacterium sp. HBTb2-11-1]SCY80703.1 Ankyrin repeat-containing protein [Flavobacterium anhuiense]
MKKSVIYLGLALVTFGNVAMASNEISTVKNQVEFKNYVGTPLNVAISKGDLETVKKFIEYGADVNQISEDLTPLMIAALYNKHEIIKILLANGANPKAKNEKGYTALKYAQASNASEAIALLKDLK